MKIIAPTISIHTARAFFDLMNKIETFQNEHTDRLNYEQYESLSENAVILRTLGNLLSSGDQITYFASRLNEAEQELCYHRERFIRSD